MSDLSATNCGCGNVMDHCNEGCGISSCLLIIILLFCCGGCGRGLGRSGDDCGGDSCIWIILLLIFCGGFRNGCDGCGC